MERLGFSAKDQDEMIDLILSKIPKLPNPVDVDSPVTEAEPIVTEESLKSPISEIEAEMTILWSGLRKPKPSEVKSVKKIVDPDNSGFFQYATFLTVMAEKTKVVEKDFYRADGSYKLRPRNKLKLPQKWTGFDSITYHSSCKGKINAE